MKLIVPIAFVGILGGCASLGSSDCTADWYQVGKRDGRLGAQPQAEIYQRRCGAAAQVDAARYSEGWRDGFAERPKPVVRTPKTKGDVETGDV